MIFRKILLLYIFLQDFGCNLKAFDADFCHGQIFPAECEDDNGKSGGSL